MMKGYRFLFSYIVFVLLLLFLLCSCSTKTLIVPEVHTEYVYRTDSFVQRDSIYVNDSVIVREKGDTLLIEKFKTLYRDRWRDVVRIDSFVQHDSIPYKVEVEKPLTWWQSQKMRFGEFFMIVSGVLLCVLLIRKRL